MAESEPAEPAVNLPRLDLHPRQAPPAHYYAENLLMVVDAVLQRYGDILSAEELAYGRRIRALTPAAQRLFARLAGRKPVLRQDALAYREVGDEAELRAALQELADAGLVERCPAVPLGDLLGLFKLDELRRVFWEVARGAKVPKARLVALIAAKVGERVGRWRLRRHAAWLRLLGSELLALYRLLFFGDPVKDFTVFVMRDLGVHRFEAVGLSRQTRQFPDRDALDDYLRLLQAQGEVAALGRRPTPPDGARLAADLLTRLWQPCRNRTLERRRSRVLNQLGRNLERLGDFDTALACYARSNLPPGRERRMRVLHRLGDGDGVEALRSAVLAQPRSALEADFARRFARPQRRPSLPVVECLLDAPVAGIEEHALSVLAADGGCGWHLENNLPMGIFGLAYWSWIFAPVEGAFVNPFQTAPADLGWPDFFAVRASTCADPLAEPLRPRLLATAEAKAGIANRLFNWRRFTPEVANAVVDAIPEDDLRRLLAIVREDLAGKSSGFPDLTVIYAPGRYEFVEVKGPNDQLQIHQRLWIQALQQHGLPVRVLRFRLRS